MALASFPSTTDALDEPAAQAVACLCCGAAGAAEWTSIENRHGRFPVRRCGACGGAFAWPRPPFRLLREYYERIADVDPRGSVAENAQWIPYLQQDAARIVSAVARLRPAGDWLDVGSGLGVFAREAVRAGYRVECVEVSPDHLQHTMRLAPGARVFHGAFEDYASEPNSKDVVIMIHILEHARQPESWLQRAASLVRDGGILVVEVPNLHSYLGWMGGRRRHSTIDPPQHLTYFTRRALERLVARHGFEPLRTEGRCPFRSEWVTKIVGRAFPRGAAAATAALTPLGRALNGLFNRAGVGLNLTLYARRARM